MRLPALALVVLLLGLGGIVLALPQQGEVCGADDACAKGLHCLRSTGILGAGGPTTGTCERRCSPRRKSCPAAQVCVQASDGPGWICQAMSMPVTSDGGARDDGGSPRTTPRPAPDRPATEK